MRVTEVTTTIRYSAEAKGAWRSLEVGATAALTASDETLEAAQQELYHRLTTQIKSLWNSGNGKQPQETPGESPAKPGNNPATTPSHWCSEHNQEWKPKNGKYGTFYSHKAPDGSWCNEAKK